MQKTDNFKQKEGREKVIEGIRKTTSLIKGTYGPAGANVIIEHELSPGHIITNDGKLIVDSISLADPYENIGANIIKEAGNKADKDSGDGRKTTMILTEAIFTESEKYLEEYSPLEIRKSLNECLPQIHEFIDNNKREITPEKVGSVATVSSEDENLGKIIQDIYTEIGKDGLIEVEPGKLPETSYQITEGVRLRGARLFGGYAYTEPGRCVCTNAKIIIAKDKITSASQIEPIFNLLHARGISEAVIYFDEIEMSVAQRLALTYVNGGFKPILVKAPTLWKDWFFEDLALLTGGKVIDSANGKTFVNLTYDEIGSCEKLIVNHEEMRVIGTQDVQDHIKKLKDKKTEDADLRVSFLNTKVAILHVGANSESELSYKTKKAQDACNASHLALKDGVVMGGGVTILRSCQGFAFKEDQTVGEKIMTKVLFYPHSQMVENSNIIDTKDCKPHEGINFKTGEVVDMFEAGIIDPALVIKNAITNAISIAGTVLTSQGATILNKPEYGNTEKMPGM